MIDVAFTPRELRACEIAVVIDVLRATSTATQALAAGYERVLCADSLERARGLRRPDRVLAGECRSVMPAGFDQGNSPLEAARRSGDDLVLATTNGAPTIVAAAGCAEHVMLAALLNLAAVVTALRERLGLDAASVQLVCSGSDGATALEDVYLAGRISASLAGERSDAARVAEGVAHSFRSSAQALAASAHARVLRANGMSADIAHCSLTSVLDCLPVVVSAGAGVAVVADGAAARHRSAVREPIDAGDTVTL